MKPIIRNFINKRPKDMSNQEYINECNNVSNHHYNDDFDLYVCPYFVDYRNEVGISIMSNDNETINQFVNYWIKHNYLEEVI